MKYGEMIPLAGLTTFHLGGPARFLLRVATIEELREAIEFAKSHTLKVLILGDGSNMLVSDKGFDGVVIKIEIKGIERQGNTLVVGAGESWDTLVAYAGEHGLWGIENLSGIPGTVGGAVVQSIGAYGSAVGETLTFLDVFDSVTQEVQRMTNAECQFGYRDSVFMHHDGRYIVVGATFTLSTTPKPNLSYRDLAVRLTGTPSLATIRETVVDIRKGKFPDLSQEGTAGSFFKNPLMTESEATALKAQYPDIPLFPMPETTGIKVPLAWLLDKVLNLKGLSVGGARLYEQQPLVIAARKNCLTQDVESLASEVERRVKEKFNLQIEREVKVIK